MGMSGEMLPGVVEDTGEQVFILNLLACVNCFDRKRSIYGPVESGALISQIEKHVLFKERMGGHTLFRMAYVDGLYCVAERDDNEFTLAEEFYTVYQKMGFTGLVFKEVWDSEA
jgi:hypothetical protein